MSSVSLVTKLNVISRDCGGNYSIEHPFPFLSPLLPPMVEGYCFLSSSEEVPAYDEIFWGCSSNGKFDVRRAYYHLQGEMIKHNEGTKGQTSSIPKGITN